MALNPYSSLPRPIGPHTESLTSWPRGSLIGRGSSEKSHPGPVRMWCHCYLMLHWVILLKKCPYDYSRSKRISVWIKAKQLYGECRLWAQAQPPPTHTYVNGHPHMHTNCVTTRSHYLASPNFKILVYKVGVRTSRNWLEDCMLSGHAERSARVPRGTPGCPTQTDSGTSHMARECAELLHLVVLKSH